MSEDQKRFGRGTLIWVAIVALLVGAGVSGGVVWGVKQAQFNELGAAIADEGDSLDELTDAVDGATDAITACQTVVETYSTEFQNLTDSIDSEGDALVTFFDAYKYSAGDPAPLFGAAGDLQDTRNTALQNVLDNSEDESTCALYQ